MKSGTDTQSKVPIKISPHSIVVFLLAMIIVNAFYLRGYDVPIPFISSASYFIPILTIFCVLYLFKILIFENKIAFPKGQTEILFLFSILITISIIYNIITLSDWTAVIQFSTEIYLNILLFISTFVLAREVNTRYLLNIMLFFGVLFALVVLHTAFLEAGAIRRVGNTELPIAVNHLSHALVVSFTIGLCRLYFRQTKRLLTLIAILLIFVAIFLTGSRSGFLALGTVVLVSTLFYGWDFVTGTLGTTILGVGGIFSLSLLIFDFTSGGGLDRMELNNVVSSLSGRFERYIDTIGIIFSDPIYIILGVGMDNYTVVSEEVIINSPHNIWLSFALYFGVPVGIAFFILHASILTNGIKSILIRDRCEITTALVLCLIVVSVYASFSGRLTRIYTIWIIMALLWEHTSTLSQQPTEIFQKS